MKCYRCDKNITKENASEEHIILNACGGRLKSKKLLCKPCNSIFGEAFDFELAKSTNVIANLLGIKRQDGEPQPIITTNSLTGEKYYLENGGLPIQIKPNIKIVPDGDGKTRIKVEAKNRKELKKTLEGLKRKYPDIDVQKALASATEEKKYIKDLFQINSNIGGTEDFKSIAKTAINYFIYKGGDCKYIKSLLPYLEGKEKHDIVWTYYPAKNVYTPSKDEVSHVLKIVGNPNEGILYVYVELFNLHCFIVRLNESYNGIEMDFDYIFNVYTYEVTENKTDLRLSKQELSDLFNNRVAEPYDKIKGRILRILTIAKNEQVINHFNELISDPIENNLGLLTKGTVFNEKISNTMLSELMKVISPFIAHIHRQ